MVDTCTKSHEKFVDFDACISLIDGLQRGLNDDPNEVDDYKVRSEAERLVDDFKKRIDKYQEQPELLEPYLAEMIEKLTAPLSDRAYQAASNKYHTTFKFLYQLIKVVGFKSIDRRFPHETNRLLLLVNLLANEDPADKLNWQTRYVLLVWLSIVILTPFDLSKFDSDPAEPRVSDRIYSTLIRSLGQHDSCQHVTAHCLARFLARPDMLREDENPCAFIEASLVELANVKSLASSTDDIKLIGHLRTLAYMFKYMPRAELKRRAQPVLGSLLRLDIDKINRELVSHLSIKLLQRIGTALLPIRVAPWGYKRGSRILGQASGATVAKEISAASSDPKQPPSAASEHYAAPSPSGGEARHAGCAPDDAQAEAHEELEAAESLESILSVLFVAAQNPQTKIRWSAAKGIARLASRLSRERASEVIDTVLCNYFEPNTSSEYAWHGGALTLAEMSRQGLILEEKLPEVTRVVGEAIVYDKIKGCFAVGAHVREAACYVFWAVARTYEDQLLAPHIGAISLKLLCTMLFDRELQCRRAASATFQELVGRQGTFNEEGISILTNVDYQSVGARQFAYLELATQVARFGSKYYEPFIVHLLDRKLAHWDVQIRRLASESLGALMLFAQDEFIGSRVLPSLSEMCQQDTDNNCKHGALLGLAQVIRSLVPMGYEFDAELVNLAGGMAQACSKQLKSKQQAPHFIEAIASLILASETAKFKFDEPLLKQWETLVFQALDSDNAQLRSSGSEALLSLYRYFYGANKTAQDRLLTILNKSLQSANESTRCGALSSLAKLGRALSDSLALSTGHTSEQSDTAAAAATTTTTTTTAAATASLNGLKLNGQIRVDSDTPDIILMSLTSYVSADTHDRPSNLIFAHAKAEACEALVGFIKTLDRARLVVSSGWLRAALDALLDKTEDYTFDKRGDIGVVVRRAAVRGLQDVSLFLMSLGMGSLLTQAEPQGAPRDEDQPADKQPQQEQAQAQQQTQGQYQHTNRLSKIISKILQQSVSYNNSAREQAALAFYRLIQACVQYEGPGTERPQVPHQDEILQLFEKFHVTIGNGGATEDGETFNWRDESTPIFVSLLSKPEYAQDLWAGLMPAVGQLSDLCAKQFRDALSDYIKSLQDEPATLDFVLDSLLATLEQPALNGRLVTNGLNVVDHLLTVGLMSEASGPFQARLAQFCWRSRSTNDPKRLLSVSRVLSSMLQFAGPVRADCLKHLLDLLLNGYSKVRVCTAELLVVGLMTYAQEPEAEAAGAQDTSAAGDAIELLSQTDWSQALDKIKPARDRVCELLCAQ